MTAIRLTGARVARNANTAERRDLTVADGRLYFSDAVSGSDSIDLTGMLLLPGLINAHDRLDLSLMPRGADPKALPPKEQLTIPRANRLMWGGIRNLLSGVTTVAHHDAYDASVFGKDFPIKVVREMSVGPDLSDAAGLAKRFWKHPSKWPFIIPAEAAAPEDFPQIERLEKLGVLESHTVLRNSPPLRERDLAVVLRRRCSLIWDPRSHPSGRPPPAVPAAMGTDSAFLAEGDLLDAVRAARLHASLSPKDIFGMVTSVAAAVFRLKHGQGYLAEGGVADLVVVADQGQSPAEAIFHLHPEMVLVGGRIRLVSPRFAMGAGAAITPAHLEPLRMEPRGIWLIDAPIGKLHEQAVAGDGPDLRLAGRPVFA